jgi:hypothetical protein
MANLVVNALAPAAVRSKKFHDLPARDAKFLVILRACADDDCGLPPVEEIAWEVHSSPLAVRSAIGRLISQGFISVDGSPVPELAGDDWWPTSQPVDLLNEFLADRVQIQTLESGPLWVSVSDLFAEYEAWSQGKAALDRPRFKAALHRLGMTQDRRRDGKRQFRVWKGCAIKSEPSKSMCATEGKKAG